MTQNPARRDWLFLGCEAAHDWRHVGGCNASCGPDCACSVPVHACSRCGESDYGNNDEADRVRADCLQRMDIAAAIREAPPPEETPHE